MPNRAALQSAEPDIRAGSPFPKRMMGPTRPLRLRADMATDPPSDPSSEPLSAEATVELLHKAKLGDESALDRLLERCIPALRRWAHGRMPTSARGMLETADLVQDAVIAAMRRLDAFEPRHQGALQAYLRKAVLNRIRDIARRRKRGLNQTDLPNDLVDERTSPLEQAIGQENLARYEAAMQRLDASDREAIVARLELQQSYEELAVVLNKPTASAARMSVTRAMKRLAQEMRHAGR
jgi:RNA polymerase sigma-70 factor (ECF subfamily)